MRKLAIALSILSFMLCCHADTSPDDRRAKLTALLKKFPCKKIEDKVNRHACESTEQRIATNFYLENNGLGMSEAVWQKYYVEETALLLAYQEEDARVRNKIRPKIGMTKEYIYRHVMGPPDSMNDTESASGISSQWVYENNDATYYLYFNDKGVLTTLQKRH